MTARDGDSRTYDRDELDRILRAAAESDATAGPPVLPPVVRDELTLAEIESIGAQVGISRNAIAAATLRVALDAAHTTDARWHHVHTIAGALEGDAWSQLADTIRGIVHTMDVQRTSDGLEFAIQRRDGELGQVRVSIRSVGGTTSVSTWSTAPHFGPEEIVVCGALGIPAAIFPVVASAGGRWPVLESLAVLSGIGFGAGLAVTLVWQQWATRRWRARLRALLTPIVAHATALAARDEDAPEGT